MCEFSFFNQILSILFDDTFHYSILVCLRRLTRVRFNVS